MASATHNHGSQSHKRHKKNRETKSKSRIDNAQAVTTHDSQTEKERRRKKKLRHKANLELKRLEAKQMEKLQNEGVSPGTTAIQTAIIQKRIPDSEKESSMAVNNQRAAKNITLSGVQTIRDDSIPQEREKKHKKESQQAVTVIKPQVLHKSPTSVTKVIGQTQSSKRYMNTSNNKRKHGRFESLEVEADSKISTAGFQEQQDEEAPKKKKNKVKKSRVEQQENNRQSTLKFINGSTFSKEKKQSQASSTNQVSVKEIEKCLSHHHSQEGISPSSKTYMVPAQMLPPCSQQTKERNLTNSIAKKVVVDLVESSEDEDDIPLTDIKPASFLRTSTFMSGQKESPIVPPGKAYKLQRDASPSPAARVTGQQKGSRTTPVKKYDPLGTDIKTEPAQKSQISDFIIDEVEISSSDDESSTVSDSDEESKKSIKKIRLGRDLAKQPTQVVEDSEDEGSIEETAYIPESSLEPISENENDELGAAPKFNYSAILPPGKKETPIPPPKPMSIKTYARSSQNSTPVAAVNATLPNTSIKPKITTYTQAFKPLSTTAIPPPSSSATKPVTKLSPPDWLTKPLRRFNSAIKASRAGEKGWEGSIQGGGLKSGFRMTLEGDSDVSPGRKELEAEKIKAIADDWEKVPGRVRGNVGADDGDIVENIAYSSTYLASRPAGTIISTTFAQTIFLTMNLSPTDPPQALSNLYPTELMLCTVTNSKVQVTLAGNRFVVSKGGMWRIRGGEECEIRYAGRALSEKCAIVLGVVVKQVGGAATATTAANGQ